MKYSFWIGVLIIFFSCNNMHKKIEYIGNNGDYKEIEYHKGGKTTVNYFYENGRKKASGYIKDSIEFLEVYQGQKISEEGKFKDGKRLGWHNFYDNNGRKLGEVFYQNDKVYQQISFFKDGSIDDENSLYVDFTLPSDTLLINEDTPVRLRYYNKKSQLEFIRVYLSNEIKTDFSNIDKVVLDTFGCPPKEKDVYLLVNFPNKGKQYIRGYLFDGVIDNETLDSYNGINLLFEKEVFVK